LCRLFFLAEAPPELLQAFADLLLEALKTMKWLGGRAVMPPKITPEHLHKVVTPTAAHGRVHLRDYFDLGKARQALNADSPPLSYTVMGR